MRLTREDRWLAAWLLLTVAVASAMIARNAACERFTGASYFPKEILPLAFVALNALITGLWLPRDGSRRSILLIEGGFYALTMLVSCVLVQGIQYTPFPSIDPLLSRWDARLGCDTVALLGQVAARPALRFFLNRAYESTDLLLIAAPLVAVWRRDRAVLRVFTYAVVYSFLAGCLFYYFFPSSGPAGVYASADFLPIQRATSMKFLQVHSRLPVTTVLGGMIAFPSFHVAWSVLLTYVALPDRRLFGLLAAWNALVIASTVLLGWHFAVDVPAGLLLAAAGLWAGRETHRRLI